MSLTRSVPGFLVVAGFGDVTTSTIVFVRMLQIQGGGRANM